MKFPTSPDAGSWHQPGLAGDSARPAHPWPDDVSPPQARWRAHVVVALVAVGGLVASAGLAAVDERPLDVQLKNALGQARSTLEAWHAELSHGLQVSLRAVADGHDALAAATAAPDEVSSAAQPPVATASLEPGQPMRRHLQPGATLAAR